MSIITAKKRNQLLEFLPCSKLSEYIQCFWYYDNKNQELPEHLVADAACELSITITEEFGQLDYQATLFGPRSQPLPVVRSPKQRFFIGVRFWPGAINVFQQRVSGEQLLNKMVPANLIWRDMAQELLDPILTFTNHEQQLYLLESFFLNNLQTRYKQSDILTQSMNIIRESAGTVKIQQVADDVAISRRQLERKFRSQIGLTPKQFGRITRIRQLVKGLQSTPKPNLLELTAKGKYSDQAHLTRECKALTGTTPQKLIKKLQTTEILQYDHNKMSEAFESEYADAHKRIRPSSSTRRTINNYSHS